MKPIIITSKTYKHPPDMGNFADRLIQERLRRVVIYEAQVAKHGRIWFLPRPGGSE